MSADRVWTREEIVELLRRPEAVDRAVRALYAVQTGEEQMRGRAILRDGRGFSRYDAEFMGRYVADLRHGAPIDAGRRAVARNKVRRYAGQLVALANAPRAAPRSGPQLRAAEPADRSSRRPAPQR